MDIPKVSNLKRYNPIWPRTGSVRQSPSKLRPKLWSILLYDLVLIITELKPISIEVNLNKKDNGASLNQALEHIND